jgi:hypothetical protein
MTFLKNIGKGFKKALHPSKSPNAIDAGHSEHGAGKDGGKAEPKRPGKSIALLQYGSSMQVNTSQTPMKTVSRMMALPPKPSLIGQRKIPRAL